MPQDIFLLDKLSCRNILDGNFDVLKSICLKPFKGLSGLVCLNENQFGLIFIIFESKKLYFIDQSKSKEKIEKAFLKNWK